MPANWKPQLVALDVDGTLLDPSTQTVSPGVRDAVRRVADSGAKIIIATGRTMLGTLPILDELGISSGVALCSNGAVTLDASNGEPQAIETFDPAPIYHELAARLDGAIFATEQVGTGSLVTSPFSQVTLHGPQHVSTVDELIAQPVPRLIANWVGHDSAEVEHALTGAILPRCTLTIDHYEPWVTVVPAGVTKGSALEKLRAELGIPISDTFAAGDGSNDLAMLEWAAHSVGMGQAPEDVRRVVDEVAPPVEQDGLVTALNRWFG